MEADAAAAVAELVVVAQVDILVLAVWGEHTEVRPRL
jgi:hypothetical protein